ncbi:MAG: glycerol-3-phosphate dehydrogenase/oxidase, partial [Frankia sp.]|nr:glycerol-3-phosphate dehydrogenase/oxidase [Frankia sp.]
AERAVELAPALAGSDMSRAYLYGDCATDDARLVLAVVRAARRFGALALTYTEAVTFLRDADGQVRGAQVRDVLSGSSYEVQARHVVNATGVWVDRLLRLEDPERPSVVQPSKGVHLVVPRERVPLDNASILLPSRQGDGRSMFAIPWGRQTILGTTDTAYDGPLDSVSVEQDDLDYVLSGTNAIFDRDLADDDIVGAWAGCRPLLKGVSDSMSDLSRRHTIYEGTGGVVTITGGKLTTYRRMAKDVVDRLVARDDRKARCRTEEIALGCSRPLADVEEETRTAARSVGLSDELADLLVRQHGEAAPDVLSLTASEPGLAEPLSPAAAHVAGEIVWAARREGAATLDDVFARRTRLSLRARDAALPAAFAAARLLARELGHDESWADAQVSAYREAVRRERGVVGLDERVVTPSAAAP